MNHSPCNQDTNCPTDLPQALDDSQSQCPHRIFKIRKWKDPNNDPRWDDSWCVTDVGIIWNNCIAVWSDPSMVWWFGANQPGSMMSPKATENHNHRIVLDSVFDPLPVTWYWLPVTWCWSAWRTHKSQNIIYGSNSIKFPVFCWTLTHFDPWKWVSRCFDMISARSGTLTPGSSLVGSGFKSFVHFPTLGNKHPRISKASSWYNNQITSSIKWS